MLVLEVGVRIGYNRALRYIYCETGSTIRYIAKNCDGDFLCVIVVSDSAEHQVTNISFAQSCKCMQPLHSHLVVVGFNATQK